MAQLWKLDNGILQLTVCDFGARIFGLSYSKDNQHTVDILQNANNKWQLGQNISPDDSGGFPLLPLANRVEHNCYDLKGSSICLKSTSLDGKEYLHGLSWLESWDLLEFNQNMHSLTLVYKDHGSIEKGYDYSAELNYKLDNNALIISINLFVNSAEERWYGLGFHPYFAFDKTKDLLMISAKEVEPPKEGYLTDSSKPLSFIDGRFDFTEYKKFELDRLYDISNWAYAQWQQCNILRADRNVSIKMTAQGSPYLMLYTQKDASFIALEPQMHAVNAVNSHDKSHLHLLKQGQKLSYQCVIEVD